MAETLGDKVVQKARSNIGSSAWSGMCQAFVADMVGAVAPPWQSRYCAKAAEAEWGGKSGNPPAGAAVYMKGHATYGHVGIATGQGKKVVHAYPNIQEDDADALGVYKSWGWNGNIDLGSSTTSGETSAPASTGGSTTAGSGIKVGSKVRITGSVYAKTSGIAIPGWVKAGVYRVDQIDGDTALLDSGGICSWVYLKDLVLDGESASSTTTSAPATTTTTPATTTTTPAPAPSTPASTTASGYVSNTGGVGLNVRTGPGTNYGRIGGLSEGATVTIIGEENGWYKINYGTGTGYVHGAYITKTSTSTTTTTPSTTTTTPSTTTTTPSTTTTTPSTTTTTPSTTTTTPSTTTTTPSTTTTTPAPTTSTGYVYNTGSDGLNVRNGPGTGYGRIGGLSDGEQVTIIGEEGGWYKINYGGGTGYVCGTYITKDSSSVTTTTTTTTTTASAVSGDAAVADFIRDNYPNGFNVCFAYPLTGNSNDAEFQNQAGQFVKEYNPIAIEGGKLATQKFTVLKSHSQITQDIVDIAASVKKCLADHPRPGFDDSKCSLIKNLTIMCHGYETGLSFSGGQGINTSNVGSFASAIKSSLASDVRVQLYACSSASTNGSWGERTNWASTTPENDPFNTASGCFAKALADALGPEASVYGHTTAGHLTGNYCGRVYGKDAGNAENGKHIFDIYFPPSFVEEQAAARGWSKDYTRTTMYNYFTAHFSEYKEARGSFIDPEGYGKRLRDGWISTH